MMFSSSSSSEDESMSNDEPLSLINSPSELIPSSLDAWGTSSTAHSRIGNGHEDNNLLHDIELSPVYPTSDNFPGETLSISEEPEHRETPGGSLQSSFSLANNNENQRKPSNPLSFMMEPLENFEEKPPLELPTQTRLKVKVKRLKIVGEWRWTDGKDDNCGICRTSFETCCVDCKFPGDDCPLALGACTHAFHMHCIVKWTNTQSGQKPVCPLCRQEWKFAS